MTNYVDLDSKSRNTLDRMTSEIRQADKLTAATTNSLAFQTTDTTNGAVHTLNYSDNADAKPVTRTYEAATSVPRTWRTPSRRTPRARTGRTNTSGSLVSAAAT